VLRNVLILLVFIFGGFGTLLAESAGDVRFTKLDSYSYSLPRAIAKDKFGFLWIGTSDGLLRFDGYVYKEFINNPNDENSISSRNIRSLFYDSSDRLWIGTSNGLNLYDYDSNTFKRYDFESSGANYIFTIYETSDKTIWLATQEGVKYRSLNSQYFQSIVDYNDEFLPIQKLGAVRTIYQDSDDTVWFGTLSNGLLRYNPRDDSVYSLPSNKIISKIISVVELTDSQLLIGSYDQGLLIVNKRDGSFVEKPGIIPTTENLRVRSIIKSSNGSIWVATQDHGLLLITGNTSEFLVSDNFDKKSLPDNYVSFVYEHDKDIWVLTLNAVAVHSSQTNLIRNYYKSNNRVGLTENNIFSIGEQKEGALLFGTYGKGIDLITSAPYTVKNIPLVDSTGKMLSVNASKIIIQESTTWVASSNGILFTNDLEVFKRVPGTEGKRVMSLLAHNSSKLLAGTTEGLFLIDTVSKEILNIEQLDGFQVRGIEKAIEDNTYWILTPDDGVFKIRLSNTIEIIDKFLINGSGSLVSMYDLNSTKLLIGTYSNGLLIVNKNDQKIERKFDESSGLPSNRIFTVSTDLSGNYWLSTLKGIVRIDSYNYKIDVLKQSNGLQSKEYNVGAFYTDSFGRFYYGGTNGVSSFFPQRLFQGNTAPKVYWSSIKILEEGEYKDLTNWQDRIIGALPIATRLNLNYNDKILLEFSTDQVVTSKDIKYLTRLNSDDDSKWIKRTVENRLLDIFLLPSGDYIFEVKASLNGYDWSEPLSIHINKAPPPWLTWWAFLGYVFALSLLASFFIRKQLQKNLEQQRIQKLIADSEERLKLALWGSRDELWDWNLISGKIHRSNTWGILNFPKRDSDENGNNSIFRNVHPKDLPVVRASLDDHRNGYTTHYEATYRVKDKDENWVWILDRGKIVEHDADGKPLRMSGTIRNITDIRDTQEQLDLIAKAFENTSDGVFILDREFKYQAVNKSYEKITGFRASDRKNKVFDVHSEHKTSQEILQQLRQTLVLEGAWQGELEDTRTSGETYTIELKLDAVKDRLDDISHYVGVFSDITYRKKAEQDLRRMANFDQLTGLPNRSLFQDRLKHAIDLSDRTSKQLILLFIDLDNFKVVNDSLGHSIGDKLLSKVAERISVCVRNNDTVARLGGDEYTILLEQVEGPIVGTRVADKILEALARPFRIQGHELVIGCSIGIASYPEDGGDVETLLRNADTAMYSAKYKDKNNYQFFTDSMNKKANTRLEMEHELRKAIPAGDINVAYQAKIDLVSGKILGCEALARWSHPDLGHVPPDEFIALAEETGLIYSLGESVLNQACKATKDWRVNSDYNGRTAVNLSTMQFRQSDLVTVIESTLLRHGLSGKDIELEITEGMLVKNPESAIQIMKALRNRGYHLSIDDFGTGYASLAQLKNFPINTLKIDKAFIDEITESDKDASVVKAILSLSENLGLTTVAEGVEHIEQAQLLSTMGCNVIQGYVYSRPVNAEEFQKLLVNNLTLDQLVAANKNKILDFPA